MDRTEERLAAALKDRYAVGEQLGRGGMATVFRAQDLKHGRAVAIKVLRPDLAAAIGPERFLREIQIAARLRHPHILPLFDSGEIPSPGDDPPLLYYIMPLVEGESLRDRIRREGRLPVEESLRIVREVAGALASAHAVGIVHRDIKPENILLESGLAMVADFGIARAIGTALLRPDEAAGQLTETGSAIGTPYYMSPEQIEGRNDLDGRSDIYSLACVLYELLSGQPPFTAPTPTAVAAKHFIDPVPRIRRDRPEVSPAIENALSRALAKAPRDRFGSAEEFVKAIAHPARPERAGRYRSARRVIAAALLIGVVATVYLVRRDKGGTGLTSAKTTVAVFPFTVRGSAAYAYLGEGMVDLLSTKLDGAGEIRAVDPRALLSQVIQAPQPITPAQGKAIADRFGAGLYVMGDIIEAGGQLQFTALLYPAGGDTVIARATAQGAPGGLFALVDSLAAKLLADWSGQQSRLTGIAAVTTSSLSALRAYLEGDRAYRAGQFDSALAAFQIACETDSTFALSWYRISAAAQWLTLSEVARSAAERAARLSHRLPERVRLLLEAMQAGQRGQVEEAERLYRSITGIHPDDVEAWIQLGELLFHFGPLRGRPVSESRAPWERVLTYEPDNLIPLIHLARIAAAEHRPAGLDSLVHRIGEIGASGGQTTAAARAEQVEMEALRAAASGDSVAQERSWQELRGATDLTVIITLYDVVVFAENWDMALRLGEILTDPSRSSTVRAVGYGIRGYLEFARGRWSAAESEFDAQARLNPSLATSLRAYLVLAPFRNVPRSELEAERGAVSRIATPATRPSADAGSFIKVHADVYGHYQAYLDGLLNAALGDHRAALSQAITLERMPGSNEATALGHLLARGILADVALGQGQLDSALALVLDPADDIGYLLVFASPFYSGLRERFLRAQLLDSLGRPEEALRWYGSFEQGSAYDLSYLGPSLLRRAELSERLGRREAAVGFYRRFVELWKDADPELQPMVSSARERLKALGNP